MACSNLDKFCCVCGLLTPRNKQCNLTDNLIEKYKKIFNLGFKPNRWYAPTVLCMSYQPELCLTGVKSSMRYSKPTLWLHQKVHDENYCYFCVTKPRTEKHRYETREHITYAFNLYVVSAEKGPKEERLKDYELAKDFSFAKKVDACDTSDIDEAENDPDFTVEENGETSLLTERIVGVLRENCIYLNEAEKF